MNDEISSWLPALVFFSILQTVLLAGVCLTVSHWASRMNQKLRNIQAALTPEPSNPNKHTGPGGNFIYYGRHSSTGM